LAKVDTLFNDADLPSELLRYTLSAKKDNPITVSIEDGSLRMAPVANASGSFQFEIVAEDDSAATDSVSITVVVEAVNDAPMLLQPLPDTTLAEDGDALKIQLDEYLVDVDNTLEYTVSSSLENIDATIADDVLEIDSTPQWFGEGLLIVTASDGEFEISDSLFVTVLSKNDGAPTKPIALGPVNKSEIDINTYFFWSLSQDTVAFEDPNPVYQLQIDTISTFDSPILDQENLGYQNVLKQLSRKAARLIASSSTGDEDSVFAVRLGSLTQVKLLEDDEYYFWRVRSVDNEDSASVWSDTRSFWLNLENDAPASVSDGFSLTDSVTTSSLMPTLTWNAATDPDQSDSKDVLRYITNLSDDSEFVLNVQVDTTANGDNYIKVDSLQDEQIYYWRVKTLDDEGLNSEWSDTQSFITNQKLDPPSPFELVTPMNNVDTLTTTPEFEWSVSRDQDLFDYVIYTIKISRDSLFRDILVEEKVESDTSIVLEESLPTGVYYWKVAAIDTDSLITWGTQSDQNPFRFEIVKTTSNESMDGELPLEFTLKQNYPNPFNPSTMLEFGLPKVSDVRIEVFNVLGQKVSTLINSETLNAGWHTVRFDATNLSSGVYLYRIQSEGVVQTRQMILIK
jgi:hypothetical protein